MKIKKKIYCFLAVFIFCMLLLQTARPSCAAGSVNPYESRMESLLDKILTRYSVSAASDWEWMVEGIAQNKEANTGGTFDLASSVRELDTEEFVAFTNLARKVMSLTARGFNCTNLAAYNGGKPLSDSNGKEVDDLVSLIYNYGGDYTINGPVFALIALDMGNYSIPADAVWTREALLKVLLEHEYLSDGFDTDMVAMLMYAIAPYRSDAVYGAQVRAKLEQGVNIIVQKMSADYTFSSWNTENSETASQVICALCACGIDCHTDSRFSDGAKSVLTEWLKFADFDGGYFSHTSSTPKNQMATYQGAYTLQWYLGFLKNGGSGHPYDLYRNRFDFASEFEKEADILSFVLEGQEGVIDKEGNAVTITLPYGTSLEKMTPELTLSNGAKLLAPELPCTFAEGVGQPFTIQAANGTTRKVWAVTVRYGTVQAAGSQMKTSTLELLDKNKRSIAILNKEIQGTDILLTVSEGIDLTSLKVKAELSSGASSNPALDGSVSVNLSSWVSFTVTAQDGMHSTAYRIRAQSEKSAKIQAFSLEIGGVTYPGKIEGTTILVSGVPYNADITAAVPTVEVSSGASCMPLSGVPQNFTNAVEYTVSGEGMKARTYTVLVQKDSGASPDMSAEADRLWKKMLQDSDADLNDRNGKTWWEKAEESRKDNDYPEYW